MLLSNDQAEPPFNIMSRPRGCDYKKIHTGSVASSNDDGAAIIEVHATPLPDFGIQPGVIRCVALLHQPGVISGLKNEFVFNRNRYRRVYTGLVRHARR
jgi:hypothetical protein